MPKSESFFFDEPGGVFQRLRGQHLHVGGRFVEQVQRRQRRIRQILEQRLLLFLDDTVGLRNNDLRRLDAYRLVLFEALTFHFDHFLALHRSLFADFPILPGLPPLANRNVGNLDCAAELLDNHHP